MKPKRRRTPDKELSTRGEKRQLVNARASPIRTKLNKTRKSSLGNNSRFSCDICGKSYTRSYNLKRHKEVHSGYSGDCSTCGKKFTSSEGLKRHIKRNHSRRPKTNDDPSHSSQPTPPQGPILSPEDPVKFPIAPNVDNRDDEMLSLYRGNWGSIRTHYLYGRQTQDVYNLRLGPSSPPVGTIQGSSDRDARPDPPLARVELTSGVSLNEGLRGIFPTLTCRVKLNLSFGFVLRNIETGELRYFHSSFNNAQFLQQPIAVASEDDFEIFLQKIHDMDVLQHAMHSRPDTKWVLADISNVTIYAYKMPSFYIGAPPQQLPDYITNNRGLNKIISNRNTGARYELFTKGSHHHNLSVILILQNLFYRGKEMRTISLNAHYMVLFKNPRDASQITHLARQMYPNKPKFMVEAYRDATSSPYSHLFVDLKPDTEEHMRLRSNIFQGEYPTVYVPKV